MRYTVNLKITAYAVFVSKDYSTNLSDWKPEDFEVIGNVYDNPKMIRDDIA